jgi:multicomponent Na+:H+ antiporter subunit B
MALGAAQARRALLLDPLAIAGFGVFIAVLSGLLSILVGAPFMTSQWFYLQLGQTSVPLSTPMVFDIGVYFVVLGTLSAVALGLEDEDGEGA